jgi:hypothetical protein
MQKILIADSGATKTDWLYVEGEIHNFFRTGGLHPAFLNPVKDANELKSELPNVQPNRIDFYGTGLGNKASDEKIHALLRKAFPTANDIEVKSDLEGSARAFFGKVTEWLQFLEPDLFAQKWSPVNLFIDLQLWDLPLEMKGAPPIWVEEFYGDILENSFRMKLKIF